MAVPVTHTPIAETPEWRALHAHHREIRKRHLRHLFAEDGARGSQLAVEAAGLRLGYSKNRLTARTIELLVDLATGILPELQAPDTPDLRHDSSTSHLVRRCGAARPTASVRCSNGTSEKHECRHPAP